jgi:hypothetical protein
MRKIKPIFGCWLLLSNLCLTGSAAQKSMRYPQDAAGVIALVDVLSQANFSIEDAVKRLGIVNQANHDDEFYGADWTILLTPFPYGRGQIKRVVLDTFDNKRKLEAVTIDFLKPISISYGELREKYGAPGYIRPPVANCTRRAVNCPPRFVGYRFSFVPEAASLASGKSLEVSIDLEMEWSKEVPQHTNKDFLVVKAIRCKRIRRIQG